MQPPHALCLSCTQQAPPQQTETWGGRGPGSATWTPLGQLTVCLGVSRELLGVKARAQLLTHRVTQGSAGWWQALLGPRMRATGPLAAMRPSLPCRQGQLCAGQASSYVQPSPQPAVVYVVSVRTKGQRCQANYPRSLSTDEGPSPDSSLPLSRAASVPARGQGEHVLRTWTSARMEQCAQTCMQRHPCALTTGTCPSTATCTQTRGCRHTQARPCTPSQVLVRVCM